MSETAEDYHPRSEREDPPINEENQEEFNQRHASNPGNNVHVSNLSPTTTDEVLRDYFSPFGELVHCQIVKEPLTGNSR